MIERVTAVEKYRDTVLENKQKFKQTMNYMKNTESIFLLGSQWLLKGSE